MWLTTFTQKIEDWASRTEIVFKLAEKYYHDVIRKEIILANITAKDHILCIGGGICPFSAILLHKTTGAKVTVIDNNRSCVTKAKQVIARLGLSKHMQVLCQDGRSSDISFCEYTVVHFALQVCPMECVFSNVEEKVAPGTKMLVRRTKGQTETHCHCPLTLHKTACNIGSTSLYIKACYTQ